MLSGWLKLLRLNEEASAIEILNLNGHHLNSMEEFDEFSVRGRSTRKRVTRSLS